MYITSSAAERNGDYINLQIWTKHSHITLKLLYKSVPMTLLSRLMLFRDKTKLELPDCEFYIKNKKLEITYDGKKYKFNRNSEAESMIRKLQREMASKPHSLQDERMSYFNETQFPQCGSDNNNIYIYLDAISVISIPLKKVLEQDQQQSLNSTINYSPNKGIPKRWSILCYELKTQGADLLSEYYFKEMDNKIYFIKTDMDEIIKEFENTEKIKRNILTVFDYIQRL